MDQQKKPVGLLGESAKELQSAPASEPKNSYWERVASRYTVLFRLLVAVLVLFVVLYMLFFPRTFTDDSVFSFFADVKSAVAFLPSEYQTIHAFYSASDQLAVSYRGGVAFVSGAGVEIYSPDGRVLLNLEKDFTSPRAVASHKYLLVYEQGGRAFSVMNAYAELYRGESEFPIYGAEIADTGHFALITSSDKALSRVLLYDGDFRLRQSFQRAEATVATAISENGKRIAFLGAGAEEGEVRATLSLFEVGASEPNVTTVLKGEMPMALSYLGNSMLCVLSDQAITMIDNHANQKNRIEIGGKPLAWQADADGLTLVVQTDVLTAQNRVLSFDRKAELLYDGLAVGNVVALGRYEKTAFLLTDAMLTRIDTKYGTTTQLSVTPGAEGVFAVNERSAYLVYTAKAEYVEFEER